MSFGELLVVESVDVLEVTVQSEEKLCWIWLGDTTGIDARSKNLAHLLDQLSLLPEMLS